MTEQKAKKYRLHVHTSRVQSRGVSRRYQKPPPDAKGTGHGLSMVVPFAVEQVTDPFARRSSARLLVFFRFFYFLGLSVNVSCCRCSGVPCVRWIYWSYHAWPLSSVFNHYDVDTGSQPHSEDGLSLVSLR